MHFPRFPMPRLYLGPVAWVFVVSALSILYFVGIVVWAEVALLYYAGRGLWAGGRWTVNKIKEWTRHA